MALTLQSHLRTYLSTDGALNVIIGVNEMAQQAKALAPMPGDLSLRSNQFLEVAL